MSDAQEAVQDSVAQRRTQGGIAHGLAPVGQDTGVGAPSSFADPELGAELVTPTRVGETHRRHVIQTHSHFL